MSVSQTAAYQHRVRDHMTPALVLVQAGTHAADAVARMNQAAASGIVVVDAEGAAVGIVTEQDVSRRLAFQQPADTAIESVMSSPLQSIRQDELLYHAIARMRRAGLRHLPVVDRDGAVVGMLHLHQALAVASGPMIGLIDRLTHEDSLTGLADVKAAQVELAAQLFTDSVPAPEIQRLLTYINNDLYRRCDRLCRQQMQQDGMGEPPVAYAFLVMGSGGRGESYLNPDQDNGLILDDYPDSEHERVDGWFQQYSDRLVHAMDDIGMPLCRGYVMAINPLWRKTRSQWRNQMDYWLRRPSESTLRLGDIFFDFSPVFGEVIYAEELRAYITQRLQRSGVFLKAMLKIDEDYGVALGLFNRFQVERDDPETKGRMNLKLGGTLPLVNALRLMSLKHGVPETSSLARIRELHDIGVLDDDDADYLAGAFAHITGLMLESQIAQYQETGTTNNFVDPEALSERERDILVDSLKAIRRLADRVRSDFTGEIF